MSKKWYLAQPIWSYDDELPIVPRVPVFRVPGLYASAKEFVANFKKNISSCFGVIIWAPRFPYVSRGMFEEVVFALSKGYPVRTLDGHIVISATVYDPKDWVYDYGVVKVKGYDPSQRQQRKVA